MTDLERIENYFEIVLKIKSRRELAAYYNMLYKIFQGNVEIISIRGVPDEIKY